MPSVTPNDKVADFNISNLVRIILSTFLIKSTAGREFCPPTVSLPHLDLSLISAFAKKPEAALTKVSHTRISTPSPIFPNIFTSCTKEILILTKLPTFKSQV